MLLSSNAALRPNRRSATHYGARVFATFPLCCFETVQTAAAASTCNSPTCWLLLAPKNRNFTVMTQPLLSMNTALEKHGIVMCVASILPLRCCNTVQTVAAASACKCPTCWLLLAPKNRNDIVMTLPLLSSIAALAQHGRVMCVATVLPLHCKLFRHLLQLPPVKLLPVACHLHPKWNCTVMMLLLLSSNAELAQHSRAKSFATAFPLCCRNYTQIPVSGVPVDYFCLSFVILKSTELPGGFLLQSPLLPLCCVL